ncbi:MAG: hypothetical protein GXO81_08415 [Chlorobi bacterium]|nr:hypothetical protein [Chlorobiota bacterium]
MKNKNLLLLIAFIFAFGTQAIAQGGHKRPDWDRFRAEKISFITQKLDLTPDEAQRFWPVYNLFDKKKMEVLARRRKLERLAQGGDGNYSEKEVRELTYQVVQTFQDEAGLMKEYNEKFLEVLPPEKVLRLYQTENQFRMYMLKRFRMRGKGDL